jgi:hypothetical protein
LERQGAWGDPAADWLKAEQELTTPAVKPRASRSRKN